MLSRENLIHNSVMALTRRRTDPIRFLSIFRFIVVDPSEMKGKASEDRPFLPQTAQAFLCNFSDHSSAISFLYDFDFSHQAAMMLSPLRTGQFRR